MLRPVRVRCDFQSLVQADHGDLVSCIRHQVHELGDIHDRYGGFPDSYSIHNTGIHQRWWDASELDFQDLGNQLGMEVITVSTIRQPPGSVIPWHRDTFYQIRQRWPDRTDLRVRANIYLQDYRMGHFIQYQQHDDLVTDVNWCQGDGWIWDDTVLHLGANVGFQDKYTLQVSGFLRQ
jgi:hypothetical protein